MKCASLLPEKSTFLHKKTALGKKSTHYVNYSTRVCVKSSTFAGVFEKNAITHCKSTNLKYIIINRRFAGKNKNNMRKQIFTLLTLALLSTGAAWANQTGLITGYTLPDIPTGTLDLASQTMYTPDANGWILEASPKANIGSVNWHSKMSTDGGQAEWAVPDGTTAPFVSSTSSAKLNRYTVRSNERTHAIRFTGASKASFLVSYNNDTRRTIVSLFSYDGSAQTLVDTKYMTSGSIGELLYDGLSVSTEYIAYIYGAHASSNSDWYEFALCGEAPTQTNPPTSVIGNWNKNNNTFEVTLACSTDGATIHYSTDNKVSYSNYSSALALAPGTTLDAYASKDGLTNSEDMAQIVIPAAPTSNTYYVTAGETKINGDKIFGFDISMEFISSGNFNTAGADSMIMDLNARYLSSISSGTNGWGVEFTPAVNGILTVGIIVNNGKVLTITNVESFSSLDTTGVVTSHATNTWTPSEKFYGIIKIDVEAGNTYKISVAGSKMSLYGFEFMPIPYTLTLGANGYSTFAADFKYTVSGATVYKAAYNGSDAVTLTAVADAVVPAGAGIILKGTEGATVTITPSSAAETALTNNELVGVVGAKVAPANSYVITTNATVTAFNPCDEDLVIPSHKAYISIPSNAPSVIRIIEAENGATNIENVEANEAAVKFIENGKLYIKKNNVVYDMMGTIVK